MTAPCESCPFAGCERCRWQSWEPGDHIYVFADNPHTHSRYVYNFRDDPEGPEPCNDAARWPEPTHSHRLQDDPLDKFLTEWRAWDAAGRPEESAA